MKFLKVTGKLLKDTFEEFKKDDPVVYSAAIAFFTIFSLPSLLVVVVNVSNVFLGRDQITSQLEAQITSLVGPKSANQVIEILNNRGVDGDSLLASVISIAIILFTSTVVFSFLQKGINNMWRVAPRPKRGLVKFGTDRLLSLGIILIFIFFLLVSLVVDASLSAVKSYMNDWNLGDSGFSIVLVQSLNFAISLAVVTVIFAMIFKTLPDVRIKWRDVWMGAIVTAVLFTIGKYLIGIFLTNSSITTTYGAAGSLVGILLWVFYSTVILMIGAEFTKVYTRYKGRKIRPAKHAVNFETTVVTEDSDQPLKEEN
ncbi:YihY/virulence factor BrkB family protein [Roseivirga sp. BDSF3-8]|uniref:YihY/virulence factor BrkB family protein n=1 Tax=Roseivirga sp. BDSF3-8 TaxID=3241598 RepID=UPI003531C490